jgi:hypothetical protein
MFISISIILLHQSIPHVHEVGTGFDGTFWQSTEMNANASDIFAHFNPGPDHLEDILPGNTSELSGPDTQSFHNILCKIYTCKKNLLKKSISGAAKKPAPIPYKKSPLPLLL